MRSTTASAVLAGLISFSLLWIDAAVAAEGDGDRQIGEILVTATKRGEVSTLDTPMAIQAFTGEQLEAQGAKQFADYARSISGLAFEDQGPGDKKIILRGIQSTGAATTGLYFDDMVVTSNHRQDGGGRQPDFRLVDMERLEVLKGPQGTLYGASSMSGTIRMISNKPDASKVAMSFNAGVGSTRNADDPNYDFDATLNVPIVQDKLAVRVVGYQSELAGFIDDELLGLDGVNNQKVDGGRASLRWNINADATLDLMAVHQSTHADGAAFYQPIYGEFVQRNHTKSQWEESLDAYNIALNWTVGHGTITASASLLDRNIFYRFPGARVLCSVFGTPSTVCFAPDDPALYLHRASADQPQSRKITSGELRYASNWQGPFQLVGGFFYQKEENDFRSEIFDQDDAGKRIPLPPNTYNNRIVDTEIEQKAVFGELNYNIVGGLTATLGVRAFEFDVNEIGQNLVTRTRPVAAAPVHTHSSDDDVTFKGNLEYKFEAGPIIYATYAEGFRSGGNNEPDFATGTVLPPYKSDTLESYELGAKGRFFGGALQLEAAAYYMEWQDLQARISANIAGSQFLILGNVGSAEIKGVELGVLARPFDANVTLGANVTALQAELTENGPVGLAGRKGDRLPNVPEFSTNVFADYGFPIGSWDSTARMDYSYVGVSYSDFNATRPIYTRQGDYSLVNLRLNLQRDNYRLGFYVNNVLDELGWVTTTIDVRRPVEVIPTRPRTFGVSFGYSF